MGTWRSGYGRNALCLALFSTVMDTDTPTQNLPALVIDLEKQVEEMEEQAKTMANVVRQLQSSQRAKLEFALSFVGHILLTMTHLEKFQSLQAKIESHLEEQ